MKKVLSFLIICISLVPALGFARTQQIQKTKKVQVSHIDCNFQEPFFKMSYNLSTRNLIVQDLSMATRDLHKGIKIVKLNARRVQMQFSNGSVFQTLTFAGKGTNGKSSQSSLFRADWTSYNYGSAPIGECHTL